MQQFKAWCAIFLLCLTAFPAAWAQNPAVAEAPPVTGAPPEAAANAVNPSLSKEDQELLYRIATGRPEDIKILLDRGADPNSVNQGGQSILAIAAEREPEVGYPMGYYLIEAGADFRKKQPEGASPFGDYILHIAILKQNYELTWLLLSKGADFLNDRTKGKNAVELAQETLNPKIISLLQQAQAQVEARQKRDYNREQLFVMLEEFAYYACAQSYMRYYVNSKQDPEAAKNPRYSEAAFQERQDAITRYASELITRFQLSNNHDESRRLQQIARVSQEAIVATLDAYVTNRNRKRQGVGTDKDLETRCKKVVSDMKLRERGPEDERRNPVPTPKRR